MGTPIAPTKCNPGDKIKDFIVKKKIGEGACGQVYLVTSSDPKKPKLAAMKIEPRFKAKEDEILKMEILVLKKMQHSRHTCRILGSGHEPTYTYVIMSILGKELETIRRRLPNRKMSAPSSLRLGIQIFKALQDLHEAGFVHRDVKPSNLAMGHYNPMVVYIFDFGLARQILVPSSEDKTKMKLRDPRRKAQFRGTVRYCSLNVHLHKEQGRHDDLYGALFTMIELVTSTLPWKGQPRKEAGKTKEATSDDKLCKGCPPSMLEIAKILRKLTYHDTPPYVAMVGKLRKDLPSGMKMTDPYEWSKTTDNLAMDPTSDKISEKAIAEKDANDDQRTNDEVDESIVTEDKPTESQESEDCGGKDDTLENL